jgi:outer membrane biosynthesis protein TonB
MDYQKAKDLRSKSFSDLMTDKLTGGQGIGSSLRETLSEKSKARMTGIKEKFDPMNIIKTLTFGSKLGPALYGKMMGRSEEDMKYFVGKKTRGPGQNKTSGQLDSQADSMAVDALGLIYRLMLRNQEDEKLRREEEKGSIEERDSEEELRNQELVKALTGRRKKEKVKEKPLRDEKGRFAKRPTEEKPKPEPTKETPKKGGKKEEAPKPTGKKPKVEKVPTPKEAPKAPEKVPVKEAPKAPEKVPPKEAPKAPTTKEVTKPSAPSVTAAKVATGSAAAGLTGRAAQVAVALGTLGITSKAAIGAIVATSAKESGLDPFKPEDGVKPWKATLEKRGVDYLYLKFPQLAKGGRVAKQLNMPDGVPADYIKQIMDKGDEAWFTLVYPGGADAYKYRGRGLIQITGKGVYKSVGDIIGIDLEKDPDAITRDFDTAAKATGAYLMNSLGRGDSKKGLAALNALSDEKEALKVVIANVARGFAGSDKDKIDKMFDPSSNLGKTTASQLEAASKYSQLGSDAASGKQIDQSSKENKDLKESLNKDKPKQSTVNNTTVTSENKETKQSSESVDDRPAHLKKKG